MEEIDLQIQNELESISQDFQEEIENYNYLMETFIISLIIFNLNLKNNTTYKSKQKVKEFVSSNLEDMRKDLEEKMLVKFRNIGSKENVLGYTVESLTKNLSVDYKREINRLIVKNELNDESLRKVLKGSGNKHLSILETLSKYDFEKSLDDEDAKYGWISVSVLDKRTSKICNQLSYKFYPSNKFKKRSEIENRPPRHFRCRSILVKVNNKKELDYAKSL